MAILDRHAAGGTDRIAFRATSRIMAGWTGRDEAALRHHIDELAALGVPPPSAVPLLYRLDPALLTAAAAIDGIRPAARFEMALEDPVLGRSLRHAYEIRTLSIVS